MADPTPEIIAFIVENFRHLSSGEQRHWYPIIQRHQARLQREAAVDDFYLFVKEVWPTFIPGAHHRIMADKINDICSGKLKRVIINLAPRHTKSELFSWLFPAFYMGKFPDKKVIQCSSTFELASGFGRRTRNLINSDERYANLFPDVQLSTDSTAKYHWHTNRGGEYFAIGVEGVVTGKGADCLAGDTLITTDRGPRRIEDLYQSLDRPKVLSYNHGTGKCEWKRIIAARKSYADELYIFNGKLKTTGNHRIYVDGKYAHVAKVGIGANFQHLTPNKIAVDRIERIRVNQEPVYDIQVEGNANFFAEEILVHNCLIIDDPHSEQEAKQLRPEVFDPVYSWYQAGPRQRLQPDAAIVVVMTRWSKRDLTGRLIKLMTENPEADQWEVVEFPAILDEGTPQERALWPQYWTLDLLKATRASLVNVHLWQGPYQQKPASATSSILPESRWKVWTNDKPPPCKFILQSWDTAFTENERSDYSACTTWGIFEVTQDDADGREVAVDNAILLDAEKSKMEFPLLKTRAKELYEKWLPDTLIVETKGSGISLVQELRLMGIPVEDFAVTRKKKGVPNDKTSRANQVTSLFHSGRVWAPERRFASEVMAECQDFPSGEHDDYVDSVVQALMRLRAGGLVRDAIDQDDDDIDDAGWSHPKPVMNQGYSW